MARLTQIVKLNNEGFIAIHVVPKPKNIKGSYITPKETPKISLFFYSGVNETPVRKTTWDAFLKERKGVHDKIINSDQTHLQSMADRMDMVVVNVRKILSKYAVEV